MYLEFSHTRCIQTEGAENAMADINKSNTFFSNVLQSLIKNSIKNMNE